MLVHTRFKQYIEQLHQLVKDKKVRRVDITASIDCWGKEQEYARHGLNLTIFETNMNHLLKQGSWLRVNINQTITTLTIKSMPALITKVNFFCTPVRIL